jgi:Zn finger protein HypA/HybF involved in hydrogenase expression
MKTISEHNDSYELRIELAMAGVLCDDCRVEMFYPDPYSMLACIPPKMTVQCPKCHKIDYKIK